MDTQCSFNCGEQGILPKLAENDHVVPVRGKRYPNSANEPPRAQNRDSGSSAVEGLHCQEKGEAAQ